ncbi:hypothetical protein BKA70DRAFT_1240624 [Coprinopsis sp. MPI-PUGE-AT-0042]|nr:hypothetical protein BKA70DRAFT_1240624 [Coprinopsis sp. MPI-PUGE-AT-0042]
MGPWAYWAYRLLRWLSDFRHRARARQVLRTLKPIYLVATRPVALESFFPPTTFVPLPSPPGNLLAASLDGDDDIERGLNDDLDTASPVSSPLARIGLIQLIMSSPLLQR